MPQVTFGFHPERRVQAKFDAPQISSDGGVLLLRQLDAMLGLCARFAKLLPDTRHPVFVVHGREEQLRQRVLQIALGYEDQNDAAGLRDDPLWKTACDRLPNDELGLSSQPTLSRFEHAVDARTVVALQRAFEDEYVASLPAKTGVVILDIDATDDPTHGQQPLAFFHGLLADAHASLGEHRPVRDASRMQWDDLLERLTARDVRRCPACDTPLLRIPLEQPRAPPEAA